MSGRLQMIASLIAAIIAACVVTLWWLDGGEVEAREIMRLEPVVIPVGDLGEDFPAEVR